MEVALVVFVVHDDWLVNVAESAELVTDPVSVAGSQIWIMNKLLMRVFVSYLVSLVFLRKVIDKLVVEPAFKLVVVYFGFVVGRLRVVAMESRLVVAWVLLRVESWALHLVLARVVELHEHLLHEVLHVEVLGVVAKSLSLVAFSLVVFEFVEVVAEVARVRSWPVMKPNFILLFIVLSLFLAEHHLLVEFLRSRLFGGCIVYFWFKDDLFGFYLVLVL